IEQNRANDSSLSRISWNRLLAESIVTTSSAGSQEKSQMRERDRGNRCAGRLRRTGEGPVRHGHDPDGTRSGRPAPGRNRGDARALYRVTAVAGKTPEPPPRPWSFRRGRRAPGPRCRPAVTRGARRG